MISLMNQFFSLNKKLLDQCILNPEQIILMSRIVFSELNTYSRTIVSDSQMSDSYESVLFIESNKNCMTSAV